jgi:hypothetical protein
MLCIRPFSSRAFKSVALPSSVRCFFVIRTPQCETLGVASIEETNLKNRVCQSNVCGRRSSDLRYLPSLSAAKPACARFAPSCASRWSGSPVTSQEQLAAPLFGNFRCFLTIFSLIESASSRIIEQASSRS